MANIKVGELRGLQKEFIKDIDVINFHGLEIEIKQYLPIEKKIELITSIFESAIDRKDGLHIVNGNSLNIVFKVLLIQVYTNLTLPQVRCDKNTMVINIIESYDLLSESGLYGLIYENIPRDELLTLETMLKNHIESEQSKYEQNLAFTKLIKNGIDGLLLQISKMTDKLPDKDVWGDVSGELKNMLDNLDVDKLDFVAKAINWNDGV